MCNCTITRERSRYIDWDGEEHIEYAKYSDCDDIDTHRFKCNQCGEIGYYSGKARAYYEEGKRSPGIMGLE